MMNFITLINKMTDEEVKHLKFDFSWITLVNTATDIRQIHRFFPQGKHR